MRANLRRERVFASQRADLAVEHDVGRNEFAHRLDSVGICFRQYARVFTADVPRV
jgi:hypothetical protein